jgi:Protein of unknown function (DUF3396)
MSSLPSALAKPLVDPSGTVVGQLALDLTVYLPPATIMQLDYLVGWYRRICPPNRFLQYAIPETQDWEDIDDPGLTKQGLAAALAGDPLPFLAPARTRIEAGRPFHVLFWDGRELDTFNFNYRQVRDEERALHTFVRVCVPASLDPLVLLEAARDLIDKIEFLSGHGGFAFGYDPDKKFDAFSEIYPLARRYWGIDVEDLNGTLTLMKTAIKGVNWLTLFGAAWLDAEDIVAASRLPTTHPLIQLERLTNGLLFRVGDAPDIGDRHRPGPPLDALMALGSTLSPLIVRDHPSFSGDGFIDHGNTNAWFHRFDDPSGWS